MDASHFDRLSRALGARLSRRGATRLTGAAALFGLSVKYGTRTSGAADTRPATSVISTACLNLGTPCGDTRVCACRLDKSSTQICLNVVDPPNEREFIACQTNVNCPDGQVCDAGSSVCVTPCATTTPPPPRGTGDTTCQNLGTACGNTAICQCRLDTTSAQTCQNVVIPPDGREFRPCERREDCGPEQVCDAAAGLCRSICLN